MQHTKITFYNIYISSLHTNRSRKHDTTAIMDSTATDLLNS